MMTMIGEPWLNYIYLNSTTRRLEKLKMAYYFTLFTGDKMNSILFFYNTLESGIHNFQWLKENAPKDMDILSIDIDVVMADVRGKPTASKKITKEIQTFLSLCSNEFWRVLVYTPQQPTGYQIRTRCFDQ